MVQMEIQQFWMLNLSKLAMQFVWILLSLLINIEHWESGSLVGFAFVFDGEKHDFVAWEAVALFFGDFENERDQLVLMLFCLNIQKTQVIAKVKNSDLRR